MLDRTAFYPSSGGQPFDTGQLGAARVHDVTDGDDDVIRHVVDAPLTPGDRVRGVIDWPRRFDHMQQHTGQHILSAAFDHRFAVRTVSFHLGAEAVDDRPRPRGHRRGSSRRRSRGQSHRLGGPARVGPVRHRGGGGRLPLRKEPARTGLLRLVDVTDFDLSACGGTHVPATGMVGMIAVAGWERFKGATRLTFVCGGRALQSHGALRDIVTAATRAMSVNAAELAGGIERLQAEGKEQGRTLKRLQTELADFRAAGYRAAATTIGPYRGVLLTQPGSDAVALKTLAQAIVSEPGMVVVLVGDGSPAPLVVARSADVAVDAGAWLKRAVAELGGRGGGRPEMAQGGVEAAADAVIDFARRTIV